MNRGHYLGYGKQEGVEMWTKTFFELLLKDTENKV